MGHFPYIDVGAVMQTMMLAAHGMSLGSGPVTSFPEEQINDVEHSSRHGCAK